MTPLDGIRAIAVLAVLIYHVWPAALRGGFIGVDVFFVISGFLITSIILQGIRTGSFSIQEFYVRRIQRLLPNMIVLVLTVLILWAFFLPPGTVEQPARHGLWVLLNLSNFYVWKYLGGYWGNDAEWAPLTHTWSLGIEEQFYLLYPSVLLLLARFDPRRMRFWLICALVVSFICCLYGSYVHPDATFYLLPTRIWELLIGAIIAAYQRPAFGEQTSFVTGVRVPTPETLGWLGLSMIIVGFLVTGGGDTFPGLIALIPTMGTVLVLLSVTSGESRVSRLLSTAFMVRMGKYSYSLYLWHWPLIIFGKMQADIYGLPQIAGAAIGGLGGIMLGWVAYHLVEKPLRKRESGRSSRYVIIGVGFSLVVFCCCLIIFRRPEVDPFHLFDTPAFYGRLYDAGRVGQPIDSEIASSVRYLDVYFPALPSHPNDAWRTGGIVHLYGRNRPNVLVLGSSHALMYSRLIDDICRKNRLSVAFLGADHGASAFFETDPSPNFPSELEAHEFDETRRRWLHEWHPDAVFIIDRWDVRVKHGIEDFDIRLRSFLNEVSPQAGQVFFVTQIPVVKEGANYNLRGYVSWRMGTGDDLPRLLPDSQESLRKEVAAKAEGATGDFPNLRVLRADQYFYNGDGSVRYSARRAFFYTNSDHLTDIGSQEVSGLFEKAILEACFGASSKH